MIISDRMTLIRVVGLKTPLDDPDTHVFRWNLENGQKPKFFRWIWQPVEGELLVGTVGHHQYMMPRNDSKRPFDSYLRGFYFVKERLVATRPFFWPETPYDEFDRVTSRNVADAAVRLLSKQLKKVRFEIGVDNNWLMQYFSKYSTAW